MEQLVYVKNHNTNKETILPMNMFLQLEYLFSENSTFKILDNTNIKNEIN